MGEATVWISVFVVGVLALGVWEYARASGNFAARWEQVKLALLAGSLIFLGVTAVVLTTLFIIVIILPEIWRPLLVVLAVVSGVAAYIFWARRGTA